MNERAVAAAFVVSTLAGLALGVVYWLGGDPQAEGVLLALSLGGIGVGMVGWAKRYLPDQEVEEPRPRLASSEQQVERTVADFARGEEAIARRVLLARLLAGAAGALGVALFFPIRSLGPAPGRGLFDTDFRRGIRVVTGQGDFVEPTDLPIGGVVTVWPQGFEHAADSPTLLVRVEDEHLFVNADGTVDGIVAYSKLCTHTGCPVGLYQAEAHLLLCPCHQSTFDVLDGARPIFGPAARSLPQLPLSVNDAGEIVATGDFDSPVGPGFWDRGR